VGRNKEFPIRLSVRSLPLLPGFAWRNELMIEAAEAERRSHADASCLLQGQALEFTENYGKPIIHASSCMTRKMAMRPPG
jgi:hypothetical protein